MACTLISDVATRLIETAKTKGDLTIAECMALLGGRSIMLGILLFSAINALPLPGIPGVSTITGIPIILFGFQIMIGSNKMWLPKRVSSHHIKIEKFLLRMEKFVPSMKKMERKLKPRITILSAAPFCNLVGGVVALMGFLLALPIPFTNFPLGFSLCVLSVGMIAQDGLIIIMGLILSAVSTIGFALLLGGSFEAVFS